MKDAGVYKKKEKVYESMYVIVRIDALHIYVWRWGEFWKTKQTWDTLLRGKKTSVYRTVDIPMCK